MISIFNISSMMMMVMMMMGFFLLKAFQWINYEFPATQLQTLRLKKPYGHENHREHVHLDRADRFKTVRLKNVSKTINNSA